MSDCQTEAEAPAAEPEEPLHAGEPKVPLSAMLAERERRRAAERALEALRAQDEPEPDADEGPDPFDAVNARFHLSERGARDRHGDAVVDAVRDWAEAAMRADPEFAREVLEHADPYGLAVEHHARALASAREAAKRAGARREEGGAGPRSLVSAPSAGGAAHTPVGPGQAFEALFSR